MLRSIPGIVIVMYYIIYNKTLVVLVLLLVAVTGHIMNVIV